MDHDNRATPIRHLGCVGLTPDDLGVVSVHLAGTINCSCCLDECMLHGIAVRKTKTCSQLATTQGIRVSVDT